MDNRKVPNPHGRKGSPEHRQEIQKIAEQIEASGFEAIKEFFIRLFSGKKKFIDVAAVDVNKQAVEFHQVGKTNKNGTPVSRERKNKKEIEEGSGIKVIFHPFSIFLFIVFVILIFSISVL